METREEADAKAVAAGSEAKVFTVRVLAAELTKNS